MLLPLTLAVWALVTLAGVLVLPLVLGWLPIIFDFGINVVLWLVWVLKYRHNE